MPPGCIPEDIRRWYSSPVMTVGRFPPAPPAPAPSTISAPTPKLPRPTAAAV
jgi:hypothetical protein